MKLLSNVWSREHVCSGYSTFVWHAIRAHFLCMRHISHDKNVDILTRIHTIIPATMFPSLLWVNDSAMHLLQIICIPPGCVRDSIQVVFFVLLCVWSAVLTLCLQLNPWCTALPDFAPRVITQQLRTSANLFAIVRQGHYATHTHTNGGPSFTVFRINLRA